MLDDNLKICSFSKNILNIAHIPNEFTEKAMTYLLKSNIEVLLPDFNSFIT